MAHELPKLPYDFAALEPHIDAQTMQIHHGKHHKTYVDNLNKALEAHPDLQSKSLDDLCRDINKVPEAIRTAVRIVSGTESKPRSRSSTLFRCSSSCACSASFSFAT